MNKHIFVSQFELTNGRNRPHRILERILDEHPTSYQLCPYKTFCSPSVTKAKKCKDYEVCQVYKFYQKFGVNYEH